MVRFLRFLGVAIVALFALMASTVNAQCPNGQCGVSYSRPGYYQAYVQAQAQLYEMADATGQRWRHTDPNYLSAWVAARNRTFTSTSQCPGQCYARGR